MSGMAEALINLGGAALGHAFARRDLGDRGAAVEQEDDALSRSVFFAGGSCRVPTSGRRGKQGRVFVEAVEASIKL